MKIFNKDTKRLRLLSTGVFGISKSRLSGFNDKMDGIFFFAGINQKEKEKIFLRICFFIILITLIGLFLGRFFLTIVLVLGYIFLEYLLINKRISKRAKDFEQDYPAFLISLASCIKSGKDPLQALTIVKDLFLDSSILKQKLSDVVLNIEEGGSEEEAISNFAKDIRHPDIELFKVAFILARREGSGLYKPLRRLTKVTRQRQSFRRKTKAAIAMQKVSAFGILGSGIFIALIQLLMNRERFIEAFSSDLAVRLMSIGGVLVLIGIVWMLYMSRDSI